MLRPPARHSVVAREGWPFIVPVILVAGGIHMVLGFLWALLPWLLVPLLIYAFRDPGRSIPSAPLGIVCPVDGKVTYVDQVADPLLARDAVRVRIRMNPLGAFSARSPIEGKVMEQWFPKAIHEKRAQAGAQSPLGADTRYAQWMRTDEEDDIVVSLSGGVRAVKPRCYLQTGERVGQGHRCGFIPLGGLVDVLLPESSRPEVEPGQKVRAGSDVIAHLLHK